MLCHLRFIGLVLGLGIAFAAAGAAADDGGQADLDKATQLKIGANTAGELGEVIRLCESAVTKGLDQNNASFATNLLAGALAQRGSLQAEHAFHALLFEGNGKAASVSWQALRKEALADLERAVRINAAQPQTLFLIARLNLLPGGDAQRAHEAIDQTIDRGNDEPQLKAEALVLRAGTQKDPAQRLADLDEATRVAPSDAAVFRARGIARAELNKLAAALDDFNQSLELDPKQAPTYQLKAMVLLKQKKLDEALGVLEKARSLMPGNIELPLMKARIDSQLRADYAAALAELDRAAAIDADQIEVLLLRAGVYSELGQKTKALADVDHILKLKPQLAAAMHARAGLLADLGKPGEAVAQLQPLYRANPKDAQTLLELGIFSLAQKKYETAVQYFSDLLRQSPEEWLAYRGRADALLNLGRRADALTDYDKALQRRPKDVGVLNNLAWLLATAPENALRDGKRALILAQEVAKLTDYNQDYVLSTLAAAFAENGDFASAEKWAAKAVSLAKQDSDELTKELASYKAHKPWREALPLPQAKSPAPETKPAAKSSRKKPAA